MKKILFLVVSVLLTSLPVMAQWAETIVPSKKNAFFLGPKAGVTFASMSQPQQGTLADGMGVGYSGGLAMKLRFGKATEDSDGGTGLLGLGIEAKYVMNNVKAVGGDKMSFGFVEVPIMFQIYPFKKSSGMNSFMIEVGPDFAFNLSSTPDVVVANNVSYQIGSLKPNDVRVLLGLGYTIPGTGLDINARYYLGTSSMAQNMTSKMSMIEVSLSYLFRVAKF